MYDEDTQQYIPSQCEHILDTGLQCGSPAMRGQDFCYYHRRAHSNILPGDSRYILPVLETQEAIQLASTHISRSVLKGKLDHRDAQTLLQAIRIAQATLKYTKHDLINENSDYQCTELTTGMEKLENSEGVNESRSPSDVKQTAAPNDVVLSEAKDLCISAGSSEADGAPCLPSVGRCGVPTAPTPSDHQSPDGPIEVTPVLSNAKVKSLKRIIRQGPRHPQFHSAARQLDKHGAAVANARIAAAACAN